MRIKELEAFKNEYGHCSVPRTYENKQLANWVVNIRRNYKNGKVSIDIVHHLEHLGFIWRVLDTGWEKMFNLLKEYKKITGNTLVPRRFPENQTLANWVQKQRVSYKDNSLSLEKINRLESINFTWDYHSENWDKMFCKYRSSIENNEELDTTLSTWEKEQRRNYKNKKISAEKIKQLESFGFSWDPKNDHWDLMYDVLLDFKRKTGHSLVPFRFSENPSLGIWVSEQRKSYKNHTLSLDRMNKLENIGFIWEVNEIVWIDMFHLLILYHYKHGHCLVPDGDTENLELANWVSRQRKLKKEEKLSEKRISLLNELSFSWEPYQDFWDTMFLKLTSFYEKHHHFKVAKKHDEQLYNWIRNQRALYRNNRLSNERVDKLNEIGFPWFPIKK